MLGRFLGSITMNGIKTGGVRLPLKSHFWAMMSLPRLPLVSLAGLWEDAELQNGGKLRVSLEISKIIRFQETVSTTINSGKKWRNGYFKEKGPKKLRRIFVLSHFLEIGRVDV